MSPGCSRYDHMPGVAEALWGAPHETKFPDNELVAVAQATRDYLARLRNLVYERHTKFGMPLMEDEDAAFCQAFQAVIRDNEDVGFLKFIYFFTYAYSQPMRVHLHRDKGQIQPDPRVMKLILLTLDDCVKQKSVQEMDPHLAASEGAHGLVSPIHAMLQPTHRALTCNHAGLLIAEFIAMYVPARQIGPFTPPSKNY